MSSLLPYPQRRASVRAVRWLKQTNDMLVRSRFYAQCKNMACKNFRWFFKLFDRIKLPRYENFSPFIPPLTGQIQNTFKIMRKLLNFLSDLSKRGGAKPLLALLLHH